MACHIDTFYIIPESELKSYTLYRTNGNQTALKPHPQRFNQEMFASSLSLPLQNDPIYITDTRYQPKNCIFPLPPFPRNDSLMGGFTQIAKVDTYQFFVSKRVQSTILVVSLL